MSSNGKTLNVILNGFNSSVKLVKIEVLLKEEDTLGDMMRCIETNYIKEAVWLTEEYDYIFHALNAIIIVDNVHIDYEKWNYYIPPNGSRILIIPPISDG